MNRLLLIVCMLLGAMPAFAQKFSYLYIQGDQKTPFYVKLEDAMQPRFGKNYCIVPRLAPGPIHIEILFQQNKYPAQSFNIQIPEDGSRAFLLVNKKDSIFQLYDLQQAFYLNPGNQISEDRVPSKSAPAAASTTLAPKVAAPAVAAPKKAKSKNTAPKNAPVQSGSNAPTFIKDLELSHESDVKNDPKSVEKVPAEKPEDTAIADSPCNKALSSDEFEAVFSGISKQNGDEEKLTFMDSQLEFCYETWQIRTLAGRFESDAAKMGLLKKLYPRTTNRSTFSSLHDLVGEAWQNEFEKLIHP